MSMFAGRENAIVAIILGLFLLAPVAAEEVAPGAQAAAGNGGSGEASAFEQLMQRYSNWGRWGDKDQLGTLNFITADVRKAAASLVSAGEPVSLAHDLRTAVEPDNPHPFEQRIDMQAFKKDEVIFDHYAISYHGTGHTHLDALVHVYHNGQQYNGVGPDVVSEQGATRNTIHAMKQGIFTRGVLIDVAGFLGVRCASTGQNIGYEDLVRWEKQTGAKVGPGDAVLFRFGRWQQLGDKNCIDVEQGLPGLDVSAVRWLVERNVAVLGTDVVAEAMPSSVAGEMLPIHKLLIVAMGMPIFDNLDLENLQRVARRHQRSTFLLTVAPLAVVGGSGSPVNPTAVF